MTAMYFPLFLGIMLQNVMSPPMFSSLYLVCESHRHATALAIVLFFANLIGLGLGPFLAGVISDYLAPSYGPAESLRWAIMILRSEERTSELQSIMRISYAVFCLKKKNNKKRKTKQAR